MEIIIQIYTKLAVIVYQFSIFMCVKEKQVYIYSFIVSYQTCITQTPFNNKKTLYVFK